MRASTFLTPKKPHETRSSAGCRDSLTIKEIFWSRSTSGGESCPRAGAQEPIGEGNLIQLQSTGRDDIGHMPGTDLMVTSLYCLLGCSSMTLQQTTLGIKVVEALLACCVQRFHSRTIHGNHLLGIQGSLLSTRRDRSSNMAAPPSAYRVRSTLPTHARLANVSIAG